MSAMASQITGVSIVYSTVCLGVDQRKYQSSFECYFGVCFLSCEATRQLNTKTTLKYTYKPFAKTVHILFYFLHDTMDPNMTIKKQSSNMGSVPNSLSSRSANNVAIDCWWRHKCIFPLDCDASTWKATNSSDVHFIHDRSRFASRWNWIWPKCCQFYHHKWCIQIAKFMGPTWGPPGSCRPQMGPMLAPLTLLSWYTLPGAGITPGIWMKCFGVRSITITARPTSHVNKAWSNFTVYAPHMCNLARYVLSTHVIPYIVCCSPYINDYVAEDKETSTPNWSSAEKSMMN